MKYLGLNLTKEGGTSSTQKHNIIEGNLKTHKRIHCKFLWCKHVSSPQVQRQTQSHPIQLLPHLGQSRSWAEHRPRPQGYLLQAWELHLLPQTATAWLEALEPPYVPSQGQSMSPQVSPAISRPACQRPALWNGSSHHPLPCPALKMLCWLHTSASPHWACSLSSEIGNLESGQCEFSSQRGQPAEACVFPPELACPHTQSWRCSADVRSTI